MSKSTTLGVDGGGVGGTPFERAALLSKACKAIHTETQGSQDTVATSLHKYRGGQGGSRW